MASSIAITVSAPELTDAIKELTAAILTNRVDHTVTVAQDTAPAAAVTPAAPVTATPAVPVAPAPTAAVAPAAPVPTASAPAAPVPAATAIPAASVPAAATQTAPTPAPVATQAATAPMPTPAAPASTLTLEDIVAAGAKLVEQNRMQEVIALVHQYGVEAVNQLQPGQFEAFAADMRKLGAQI